MADTARRGGQSRGLPTTKELPVTEDRQLQEAVLAEFYWDPAITAAHIGVVADHGVITLTGHVPSYFEKSATERAALRVRGVKAVAQDIEVFVPVPTERSDAEIARAALDRIAWDVAVPADAVAIRVEHGWVTLSGEVHWQYQREAAETVIRGLRGLTGITNLVTITAHLATTDIAASIDNALHRAWFDRAKIRVSAHGGAITLDGTVHTPAEKRKAAITAWAAPGATQVHNNLVVTG